MSDSYTTNEKDKRDAAAARSGSGKTSDGSTTLDDVPDCVVTENATQKYVLIRASTPEISTKFIVRGDSNANYHLDAAKPALESLERVSGCEYEVLGGGRIRHDAETKSIEVYGFSYGFPFKNDLPLHNVACICIKERYPEFNVSHDDDPSRY